MGSRWVIPFPTPPPTPHPLTPLPPPQTGTMDSGLALFPSQSDVPGQLQAHKPGTFQGVPGPKNVTILILSESQRVLILFKWPREHEGS